MVNEYPVIIVDFNNLFFRTFRIPYKEEEEYSSYQREDNINNYFKNIDLISETFEINGKPPKIIMVSDFQIDESKERLSSKYYRRQIYPEYKANRKTKRPEIVEDMKTLISMLKTYRDDLHLISVPGYEADDLVGAVINLFSDRRILLVSNDGDWAINLKQDKVDIYKGSVKLLSPMGDIEIETEQSFIEEKGYSPNPGVLIYKSIRGDAGDNIPKGVLRLPEELVIHSASTYKTVDELIEKSLTDEIYPQKWKDKIQESAAKLRLNEKLVGRLDIKEDILNNTYSCMRG